MHGMLSVSVLACLLLFAHPKQFPCKLVSKWSETKGHTHQTLKRWSVALQQPGYPMTHPSCELLRASGVRSLCPGAQFCRVLSFLVETSSSR